MKAGAPPIPIDEITYRGLESISEPTDLCHIFERIFRALPGNVTKKRCIEEFNTAWNREYTED